MDVEGSRLILGAHVTDAANDQEQLVPGVASVEAGVRQVSAVLVDSGFYSEATVAQVEAPRADGTAVQPAEQSQSEPGVGAGLRRLQSETPAPAGAKRLGKRRDEPSSGIKSGKSKSRPPRTFKAPSNPPTRTRKSPPVELLDRICHDSPHPFIPAFASQSDRLLAWL